MTHKEILEIKQRVDILDLIGGYLQLRRVGVNYRALCPFHDERTPSFIVSPVRKIWRCFGCGASGDIFEFVKRKENVGFVEAARILSERAGLGSSPAIVPEKKNEIIPAPGLSIEEQLVDGGLLKKIGIEDAKNLTDKFIKAFKEDK